MHSSGTVPIYADDDIVVKGAFPGLEEISARVHDVSQTILAENFNKFLLTIEPMLAQGSRALTSFAIKEVKVALAVNGAGEFSLLGLTTASAEIKATIEVVLVPN